MVGENKQIVTTVIKPSPWGGGGATELTDEGETSFVGKYKLMT